MPTDEISTPDEASTPDEGGLPDIDAIVARFAPEGDEPAAEAAPEEAPEAQEPAPAPEPPAPVEAKPDAVARNAEILAGRQREIHAAREALRAEREEIATHRAEVERFRAFQRQVQDGDALQALAGMGIEFDQLAQAVLDGRGLRRPEDRIQTQVEQRLREMETRMQVQLAQVQRLEYERAEHEFHGDASAAIQATAPALAALGSRGVDLVRAHYQDLARRATHLGVEPDFPPYEDVAREVEGKLLELLSPVLQTEPVRSRFSAPSQTAAPAPAPTLSNRQATETPRRNTVDLDTITDRDARIDAIAARYR